MRKIILASHGELSKGLLHSAKMIIGDLAGGITTFSLYPGEDAADYAFELRKEIEANKEDEYVVIADLFGASVCSAMMPLTDYENVKLFTGLSLAMLLTLLTEYPGPLTESDVEELLKTGKDGIENVCLEVREEEDF